jgi:hypothetical protein
VVRADCFLADRKSALVERLGLSIADLTPVNVSQPQNGGGVLKVVFAMLLTSHGNPSLGYRRRFCVLALAAEPADLGAQGSKHVDALCAR